MNTYTRASEKAAIEEARKSRRKQEQAAIVVGLQSILEGDENILAFLRGRIAGGWKGKLTIGPEAFFAPYVNVGLTDRRLILQHIHPENDRPSEILPHFFPLEDIASVTFSDIETFGGEPAGRLAIRLKDEQHIRVRLAGDENSEDATAMVEVFKSLLLSNKRSEMSPTQTKCASCGHILDQPFKFCPYCGQRTELTVAPPADTAPEDQPPTPEPAPIFEATPEPTPAVAPTPEPSPVAAFSTPNDQPPTTSHQPPIPEPTPGPAGAFGIFRSTSIETPVEAPPAPSVPESFAEPPAPPEVAEELAPDNGNVTSPSNFAEPDNGNFTSPSHFGEPDNAVAETPPPPVAPEFSEFSAEHPEYPTPDAENQTLDTENHAQENLDAEQPRPSADFWQNVVSQAVDTSESPTEPNSAFASEMRAEEMPPEPEPSAPSDTQDLTQHPTPDTQHPTPATPDDSEGDTKDETDAPPANPWQSNPWQGDL